MHVFSQLRGGSLPLLLGLLSGVAFQLSGPLHYLVVEHSVCSEHGETIHAGEAHGHAHAVVESAAQGDGVRGSGEGEHGPHEHCMVAGRERDDAALTNSGTSAVQAATVPHDNPPAWQHAHAARPLDAAPKTSPPRLG